MQTTVIPAEAGIWAVTPPILPSPQAGEGDTRLRGDDENEMTYEELTPCADTYR